MHIPDGMLSTPVAAASGVTGLGFIAYAVSWTKRKLSEEKTVLMSVMSALVFALQMLNFPIAPGISGHFAGGAAAAILLGPWPAAIVMTTVLLVQAFLFADGGVVALGANVLNLAVIGPFVGYLVWRVATGGGSSSPRRSVASFTAAWAAVVIAASAVAVEVWLSGRAPLGPVLGTLAGWHALVGVGEGLITAGLVAFVARVRPDVLGDSERRGSTRSVAVSLALFALIAAGLSWLASSRPDALEFVAGTSGFAGGGESARSPFSGYALPGIANDALAGVLAGLIGVVVAGALLFAATRAVRARTQAAHRRELHGHAHIHAEQPEHEHPHHHGGEVHEHAHPLSFERYTYVVSPLHALDPRAKIVAVLVFVLGVVLSPPLRPAEFVLAVSLILGLTLVARLPLRAVFGRSAWVLIPAITISLFAPFTDGGWALAWSIVTKAWLSALAVLLLSATTPPPRLLLGLRKLGMPAVFVETLTFLYRFVAVLTDQVRSMRRAIASRGYALGRLQVVRLYGNLAGNLFLRSYERGERVHSAMLSRGFTGVLPAAETLTLGWGDAAFVLLAAVSVAAIVLY